MNLPVIGFLGLTHLGLNSAVASAAKGFEVVGYHSDSQIINDLKQGSTHIIEPNLSSSLKENLSRLSFSDDLKCLKTCDLVYLSVDVPTNDKGESDLSSIETLLSKASEKLKKSAHLIILCQVPPGFTRKLSWPKNQLFYQVETLIFGRAMERALYPERFILGCDDPLSPLPERLSTYLREFNCPILPMRYESAELAKIAINMFLISSVSTTNMLAEVCEKIGASWSEIAPALRLDKRIGPSAYLSPGLGIAGGNLERDMGTISNISREHKTDEGLIKSWQFNSNLRKDWLFAQLQSLDFLRNAPTPLTISLLGLTYKENTHSLKNSASINFLKKLAAFQVKAYDPSFPKFEMENLIMCSSIEEALEASDLLVIATPWQDFKAISLKNLNKMQGKVVLDPYGLLKHLDLTNHGFIYQVLGEDLRC